MIIDRTPEPPGPVPRLSSLASNADASQRGPDLVLRVSSLLTALVLLTSATACSGDDYSRFLSFERLCPELASDVCSARVGCCGSLDLASCETIEEQSCRVTTSSFSMEPSLAYDAVAAAAQHQASHDTLDSCGPPTPLAAFFIGGLRPGTPCERDAQCTSGACAGDPRVCLLAQKTLCLGSLLEGTP